MAEHSLLHHMMSLSQFSTQTCKSTLWPLCAHIHAWRHNNTHHWRSMIKMALSLPLQLAVVSVLSIVSFAVSWRGHGMYVCCALWLHYSSVGLTLWLWFLAHGFRSGQKSYFHSVEGIELAVNGLCSLKKSGVPIPVIIWQRKNKTITWWPPSTHYLFVFLFLAHLPLWEKAQACAWLLSIWCQSKWL